MSAAIFALGYLAGSAATFGLIFFGFSLREAREIEAAEVES